jgi:hypothetical protein
LRVQHQEAGIPFSAAIRLRRHRISDEPVAILDQQMAEIRQPRFGVVRFAI